MPRTWLLAVTVVWTAPVAAKDAGLTERIAVQLRRQVGPGARFGLLVTDGDGREVVAIDPDDRFVPASNTKLFTTAAAFDRLNLSGPDTAGATRVRLAKSTRSVADVVIEGRGDARLSSRPDCRVDCLSVLADAVAAKVRRVGDVVGDDSHFPDQRWSPGMSWNNMAGRSGTGISALTLDDNELVIRVSPAPRAGEAAHVDTLGYYAIDSHIATAAGGPSTTRFSREPNGATLHLDGTIAVGSPSQELRVGIDDPADYAAWRMKALLKARGVEVTGRSRASHRPWAPEDDPATRGGSIVPRPSEDSALAVTVPAPLTEDLRTINKDSQNLHAELALRRIGRLAGNGSIADGEAAVRSVMDRAGVARWAYDLSDGSGMSSYNRVTPRAVVGLLRWTIIQPWGEAFRATLPIAGVDGTLARRFKGTLLEGRLFAKTGSLNQANALAGFLTAKSGRTLTFAAYANDMPGDVSATAAIDAALVAIAEAN